MLSSLELISLKSFVIVLKLSVYYEEVDANDSPRRVAWIPERHNSTHTTQQPEANWAEDVKRWQAEPMMF